MRRSIIQLSVVIAAQDAKPSLKHCVAALAPQLPPSEMEILVVAGSGCRSEVDRLKQAFPSISILCRPASSTVPQLWSAGIAAARGEIVALTIENCVPAADWARKMIAAHEAECSGVGGAIENAPQASIADWAVYFSRYSSYMLPFPPRFLEDLPGDNCSYKRASLGRVTGLLGDGFWETLVHHDMRGRSERLLSEPSPVVVYHGGLSPWRFFRRRFLHGRYFGARRSQGLTTAQRLVRAAGFPAVPPLLLSRMAGRIWRNGRHRREFLLALPLMICFLLAWAAGEGAGYLAGPSQANPPARD